MKARKRFILSPLMYLIAYLCLPFIHLVIKLIVDSVYGILTANLPQLFREYNLITHPEEYKLCTAILSVLTLLISLYIAQRFYFFLDNGRFEYIITKTDGLYTMPEGLRLYYRSFLADDIITCVLTAVALSLPVGYIPPRIMEMGVGLLLFPGAIMTDAMGKTMGIVMLCTMAVATRALASLSAVKEYRANWLSGAIE